MPEVYPKPDLDYDTMTVRRTSELAAGDVIVSPGMVVYADEEPIEVTQIVVSELRERETGALVVLGTCRETDREVAMPSFPSLYNIIIPATPEESAP